MDNLRFGYRDPSKATIVEERPTNEHLPIADRCRYTKYCLDAPTVSVHPHHYCQSHYQKLQDTYHATARIKTR